MQNEGAIWGTWQCEDINLLTLHILKITKFVSAYVDFWIKTFLWLLLKKVCIAIPLSQDHLTLGFPAQEISDGNRLPLDFIIIYDCYTLVASMHCIELLAKCLGQPFINTLASLGKACLLQRDVQSFLRQFWFRPLRSQWKLGACHRRIDHNESWCCHCSVIQSLLDWFVYSGVLDSWI